MSTGTKREKKILDGYSVFGITSTSPLEEVSLDRMLRVSFILRKSPAIRAYKYERTKLVFIWPQVDFRKGNLK